MRDNQPQNTPDPFPPSEFDAWAESYDENVGLNTGFPFDGYDQVLDTIVKRAGARPGEAVLDLGTGTGNLAGRFARLGCQVWGLDFSGEMLARARQKLPQAIFAQADLRSDWAAELPESFQRRFERIVSAYTFHHFPLAEKVALARHLLDSFLVPGGVLVIGDIAFQDAAEQDRVRASSGDEWEDEYFWLADETLPAFAAAAMQVDFTKISSCAGAFKIIDRPEGTKGLSG